MVTRQTTLIIALGVWLQDMCASSVFYITSIAFFRSGMASGLMVTACLGLLAAATDLPRPRGDLLSLGDGDAETTARPRLLLGRYPRLEEAERQRITDVDKHDGLPKTEVS